MDPSRELIDAAQAGRAVALLSGVALVLAILLGAAGRLRGAAPLCRGALLAAATALLYPLWLLYNRIEDHFGLDSVAALGINLVLFALVGVLGGLLLRRLWPEDPAGAAGQDAPAAE